MTRIEGEGTATIPDARAAFWRQQLVIRWPGRETLFSLAALAALVLLLFRKAAFGGEVFYERDIQFDWYPQVEAFVRAVASGSWPLWDNTIGFGQPLWADPSAQVLYPFTWLHFLVRPGTYYTLFVLFHLWFGAMGVYLAARRLLVSQPGALTAAGLWACSGPLLSTVNLWHHFAGACWIPWVFLSAQRTVASRRTLDFLLLSISLAAQILAGSADMVALTHLVVGALVLREVSWRRPWTASSARVILGASMAWSLAAALTAAQWLPALEAARRSGRWALPAAERTAWSVPPLGLLQTLFPVFLEDLPLRPPLRQTLFEWGDPFLASLYLGLPTLALAAASFLVDGGRHRRFLLLLTLGAALFALGHHAPFHSVLTTLLPFLRLFRYPVKAMLLPAFALALLAGLGFDAWRSGAASRRSRTLAVLLPLLALFIPLAMAAYRLGPGAERAAPALLQPTSGPGARAALAPIARQLAISAALSAAVLAAAAAAWGRARSRWSAATAAGAAVLAITDLVVAHQGLNATAPRRLLAFRPPVLEAVRQEDHSRLYVYEYFKVPGKSRRYLERDEPYVLAADPRLPLPVAQVLSQRLYPAPPAAGRWGFESSYDLDFRRLYPWYLSHLTWLLRGAEETPLHLRLLRMGAVSHVIALHTRGLEELIPVGTFPSLFPEPILLFRVPDPLPRAYAVGRSRVVDGTEALEALQDASFDPSREVLLAAGPVLPGDSAFSDSSRVVELKPDRVRLEVELASAGFVVSVDSYDPGWRVRVDGQEAPALRANLAFRAVYVPAGRHTVEWVYRPRAVVVGLVISAAAALAGVLLAWRVRRA